MPTANHHCLAPFLDVRVVVWTGAVRGHAGLGLANVGVVCQYLAPVQTLGTECSVLCVVHTALMWSTGLFVIKPFAQAHNCCELVTTAANNKDTSIMRGSHLRYALHEGLALSGSNVPRKRPLVPSVPAAQGERRSNSCNNPRQTAVAGRRNQSPRLHVFLRW
jgi:hypothetical protein